MTSLPFTLRQLEVFAQLASAGSFRITAENLGITQASVSNQIKTLEEQLGQRLLDRKPGRRPMLTPAGQAFHEDLCTFEKAAQMLASHRRSDTQVNKPVIYRLLVGQGMFDGYIRSKLDGFLTQNPSIELDFHTQPPSHALVQISESRQVDFALINQRTDQPEDAAFERLAKVRGGIYGHKDLAGSRSLPLSLDELNELPFFLPQAGSRQEREVLQSLADIGIRPRNIAGHTQYYDVMAAVLERGVAVASFSEAILPQSARENVVLLRPIDDWYLEFYRRDTLTDPTADIVESFLKQSVLEDPAYPAVQVYA